MVLLSRVIDATGPVQHVLVNSRNSSFVLCKSISHLRAIMESIQAQNDPHKSTRLKKSAGAQRIPMAAD